MRTHPRRGPAARFGMLVIAGALVLAAAVPAAAAGPPVADPASYRHLEIAGDPGPTGVFDAAVVFPGGKARGWMAYSTSNFHEENGASVQDLGTAIASSSDAGASWQYVQTVNEPYTTTVTPGDPELCGQEQCEGRLVAEVPFLVHDPEDPAKRKRFKLYTFRYLFYPPGGPDGPPEQYHLGAITVRTASRPDKRWSKEKPAFGWNLTPPELRAPINLNTLSPEMEDCLLLSEADAVAVGGELDFAFTCPVLVDDQVRYRIVLFRSTDHGKSLEYVGTLLEPEDAATVDGISFNAADLARQGDESLLLVTRVEQEGEYNGCAVIPFDREQVEVERGADGAPVVRHLLPTLDDRFGGACSWDEGATGSGVVMSQLFLDEDPARPFRVDATGVVP